MAASCDLNVAKKNLQESLGENMKIYLQNLKSWFKQKISKEDFDMEARRLLRADSVHLHNEFLLAIISRCQSLSSSIFHRDTGIMGKTADQSKQAKLLKQKNRKRPQPSKGTNQRFLPSNPVDYAIEATYRGGNDDLCFAAREHTLPDISMVHGRMLVCAWETGLDEVSDTAIKLVMQSVENQLKNLISVILSWRSGYKLREKKFRFAVGSQVKNPYLRRSNLMEDTNAESEATMISQTGNHIPSRKPPLEIGEVTAAEQLASAQDPLPKPAVSLYDVLEALQSNRGAIPSHDVYAPAVERVIHKLWHPSNEDFAQEIIHRQEVSIKQQMSPQLSQQPITGHVSSSHYRQQPISGLLTNSHASGLQSSSASKQKHMQQSSQHQAQQSVVVKTEPNLLKIDHQTIKMEDIKSEPQLVKSEQTVKSESNAGKSEHHHHHHSSGHHKSDHHHHHHKSSPSHHHHHHHRSGPHHQSTSSHHSSLGHHSSGHRSSSGHHTSSSENQIPSYSMSSDQQLTSVLDSLPRQQQTADPGSLDNEDLLSFMDIDDLF